MSGADSGGLGSWYAQPALAGGSGWAVGFGGGLGGNVSNPSIGFGAAADGRATFRFINHVQVELEKAEAPTGSGSHLHKQEFQSLLRILRSRLEPSGPAHTWGERMMDLLPRYYRSLLHEWLRAAYNNEKLYAQRLAGICTLLNYRDLAAQDGGGGSLLEVARQSAAQYLQRHAWKLKPRDPREPPLPGPAPRFILECMQQAYTASRRGTTLSRSGQASASAARQTVQPARPAAPQASGASGASVTAAAAGQAERDEAGGSGAGAQEGSGAAAFEEGRAAAGEDEDSEMEEGFEYLLPLEQVESMQQAFEQLRPGQGTSMFSPPPRNPPYWPALEELEEMMEVYPDWEFRLPARMPNPPEPPQFSDEDADTARALEQFRAEVLAGNAATDIEPPKMSACIMAAFSGPHLKLKPEELAMLTEARPEEHEDPMVLCTRMLALVQIKGGEARWPMALTVNNYLSALEHYGGNIANSVSDYISQRLIDVEQVHVRQLAKVAKAAWDDYIRRYKRAPKLKQPKQQGGAQASGRDQRGGDRQQGWRQSGNWDRGGSSGQRLSDRREQPQGGGYNRGGSYNDRRANAAELVDDSYYSAHAAQQAELAPATYSAAPPPRHYGRYVGGGGSSSREESCVTCGLRHGPVCFVEQPKKAPDWWGGPRSLPVYEAYVLNCKAQKVQPLCFAGRMPGGRGMSKEVADYLVKMGDRQPTGKPQGPGAGAGTQHQGGAGRAAGVGFMAETAGPSYPHLSDTFRKGTRTHAEEEQDDADTAYYAHYAESEPCEVAEALVSTRRSGGQLPAAATQAAAGSSQQRDAPAKAGDAASGSTRAARPSIKTGGTTPTTQPAAAAVLQSRPPLPTPVAARQPAVTTVGQAPANPTVAPAVAPAPAGRPKPPLPFTTIQPAEGTPPSHFPQPVLRYKGSTVQQAVARGGLMQQLPVSISLHDLAHNPNVSAEALKQLLGSGTTELATMQRSAAQGQMGTNHVVVTFGSMAEAMKLLSPTQAFAALEQGEEQLGQLSIEGAGEPVEEPTEAQEAAGVAAGEEQGRAVAAAKEGEGAAASTERAAAGHVAARLKELEGPNAVTKRPSTFELLAQTQSTPGITVALLKGGAGQDARVLTGSIHRFIIDSGADVVLMSEDCAKRNQLPLVPSNRRICTSSGQVTCTLQMVDHPVQYVLGKGTPHECAIVEDTYVMPGSGSTYDVLLGTPLIIKWGLCVDPLTSTATYRPFWHSKGDSRTQAQVPVLTHVQVPAPQGAAKASKLIEAQPELLAEQQHKPKAEAEPEAAQPEQAVQQQLQQPAPSAQVGLTAVAEVTAAAEPLQQQPGAQTSVQANYEPPTSFMIMAA